VCGEEDPNIIDLTPKLLKLSRPRAPNQNMTATHSYANSGEKPKHDSETPREAHARGGPKTLDLQPKMRKNHSATHIGRQPSIATTSMVKTGASRSPPLTLQEGINAHDLSSKDFFFFLISNFKFNKKAQRGATLIHGKYTRVPLNGRNS
jgi:hypothetical protein